MLLFSAADVGGRQKPFVMGSHKVRQSVSSSWPNVNNWQPAKLGRRIIKEMPQVRWATINRLR